ncbi:TonB-dependent receptor [Pontibacter chitinilyticus]|uniref:TonB-dependent receptor n=1 Tax=Pontibacter chitinilyticus TaxID=2674989 RepID=UPI00321C1E46
MHKRLLCLGIGWLAIAFTVLAQASLLDRKASINSTNATIQEVLSQLAEKYDIPFSYGDDLVPLQQKVSIKADNQPLRQVLDEVLKNSHTRYTVIGGQIILQPVTQEKKERFTISGHITDAASGEDLAGAIVSNGRVGAASNTYGFYSLSIPASPVQLQVRYLGYHPLDIYLPPFASDTTLQLALQPLANQMQEVNIVADKVTDLQQANRLTLRATDVKQLPRLMGEADAIKALQLMPGVQAGRDGSSDLIVRGGSPDQNLVLLDGVPVYNVSHLLGTFSVFNPDAIKTVDLIKGGFPAPYGGRLSSVVDVQLKEGNNQRFTGEGAIGLMSSKLLLEGPVKKDKTSYLLAVRRTYLDLLAQTAAALSGETIPNYNFYDLNAKINHTFSPTNRLYLSAYTGRDNFADKQEFQSAVLDEKQHFKMHWGNETSTLRWNHVFGPRLFSNLTLTHSRYSFNQQTDLARKEEGLNTNYRSGYSSGIKDWGAKADFDYALNPRHSVRFGGNYTYHSFMPESVVLQTDTIRLSSNSFSEIRAHEFYTYADDRVQLSERLQATVGLHVSGFAVNRKLYTSLQPRLALGYTSATGISVRASYATMAQYLHLLSNPSTGAPTDIWVPATDKVKPQRSWQATLGAATVLGQQQWEITSDLYYKEMHDMAEFKDGADFISDFLRAGPDVNFANFVAPPYQTRITSGKGWSYGSEWLLRKRQGKTTGWLGYTLSWSWRQLDSINFGRKFPYTYDSRHSLSLVVNHQLTEKLSIGGIWTYRTGYVTTLPVASYKAYNEPHYWEGASWYAIGTVDYLGERNNYRMPAYHRFDLSLTHTKKKRWGERSWNISIYNAYNRKNPYFMQVSKPYSSNTVDAPPRKLYQVSLFPFLPSLSYGFKF